MPIDADLEQLSALIGLIYDAALDPGVWKAALAATASYLNAADAMLLSQEAKPVASQLQFHFHWNDSDTYNDMYAEKYAKLSPLVPMLMLTQIGDTYAASRMMPYEELRNSTFFKEWVLPQDRVDFVATTLDRSPAGFATAFFGRSTAQGLVDDETLRRMELVAPHLRRATLIGRTLTAARTQSQTLSETLDGLATAVFLINGRGGVTYANVAAREMLRREEITLGADSLPAAGDAERPLRAIFAAAANSAETIAMPLSLGSGAHMAHMLPLNSGARRAYGSAYGAVAAVFVRRATLDLSTPVELVAQLYKLSRSEIRVLYAVVELGSVSAMAEMLGLSEATVKTHLQHLFEKTGTSRQIDLIKIVAAHASPLAG